jgi:hypothetical protein
MITPPQEVMRVLLGGGAVVGLLLIGAALRPYARAFYPQAAVGAILLLSHVLGLALIQGNKSPMYVAFAVPYALASLIAATNWLAGRIGIVNRAPATAVVGVLAALSLLGAKAMIEDARSTPDELGDRPEVAREARAVAGPHGTVMGEWLYWWAFRDERFRVNSLIWLIESQDGVSFEAAFRRLCPDVVMLDDIWLSRYEAVEVGEQQFPAWAPTDASEQERLMLVLNRYYAFSKQLKVGAHRIDFWRLRSSDCRGVLTSSAKREAVE